MSEHKFCQVLRFPTLVHHGIGAHVADLFWVMTAEANQAACGCDCGEDLGEPDPAYPIQCWCTMCGPTATDGSRQCRVRMNVVAAIWTHFERGKAFPNDDSMYRVPAFCGYCREHNLLRLRRDAVHRMQKHKRHERRERSRSRDGAAAAASS